MTDTSRVELSIARLGVWRHEADATTQRRRLARETVALWVGCKPDEVAVSHGSNGEPSLLHNGVPLQLAISTASCSDVVVIALAASGRVGVDVQAIESEHPHVQQRALAPAEFHDLHARPAVEVPAAWMAYWTRKEALLKGLGVGLRIEPASILLPRMPRAWDGHTQLVSGVGGWITSWQRPDGFVVSLWTEFESKNLAGSRT